MKKILFVLLLFPVCSFAQLELSANDGVAFFKPLNNYDNGPFKMNPQNVFDANIFYGKKHLKIGIGYIFTAAKYTSNYEGNGSLSGYNYNFSQSIKNIYLSGRYESNIGRSFFYEGISVGYVGGSTSFPQFYYIGAEHTIYEKTYGYAAGAYIGYAYDFWKGLCIDAQVGATYINTTTSATTTAATLVYFPVTAGIRYNIHFHKKAKQETPATQVIKGM